MDILTGFVLEKWQCELYVSGSGQRAECAPKQC
jgi:hypothetical protein